MATCKSCNAAIEWVKTAAGKNMPCDAAVVTIVTELGSIIKGRVPHWATCPSAGQHRSRPPSKRASER
jgi:hypothetical protein